MIHPTAIIEFGARVHKSATIGPWCYIGSNVRIGAKTHLVNNVSVVGKTTIGKSCHISSFSVLGGIPQDHKYNFEDTKLSVGDRTRIHEFVTINLGTIQGGGETQIGSDNIIMSHSHIAHDTITGKGVKIASYTGVCGHVTIEDYAVIGGMSAIKQFCKIGAMCYIAAHTYVDKDIPPFMIGRSHHLGLRLYGVNITGLRRQGYNRIMIQNVKRIFNIWQDKNLSSREALNAIVRKHSDDKLGKQFLHFIQSSQCNIVRERYEKMI